MEDNLKKKKTSTPNVCDDKRILSNCWTQIGSDMTQQQIIQDEGLREQKLSCEMPEQLNQSPEEQFHILQQLDSDIELRRKKLYEFADVEILLNGGMPFRMACCLPTEDVIDVFDVMAPDHCPLNEVLSDGFPFGGQIDLETLRVLKRRQFPVQ